MLNKKVSNKIHRNSDREGFTLLELLLAFAIMTMVLSMAYTILMSTLNARERIHAMSDAERAASRLLTLISRDIQAAHIYQVDNGFVGKNSPEGSRLDFVCNTDSLMFSQELRSDLCEVSYFTRPNPEEAGTFQLLRREEFFIDNNLSGGGYAVRLYDRLLQFQLRYFDPQGSASFIWDSSQQGGLPVVVEVSLKIPLSPPGTRQEILYKNARTFRVYVTFSVSPKPPRIKKEGAN